MAKVYASSVIEASVEDVWKHVRDFNGLPKWHPAIAESSIEQQQASDQVGCIRNFRLKDGGVIRERLLALSDVDRVCTYAIVESPLGVDGYVATLRLTRVTDGNHTFAEWSAEFLCPPERERALIDIVGQGVFQQGFSALKAHFRQGRAPHTS
ncbi:SRPBCC family protein [Hyalangium versicolor]|uniref:SRPBCC family protein n=1 Tax=Hyalangium versicolor TaxID=2861190 RepID=UPI001CCB02ED|nr:SRPBCC family protein [Hyalangium versicolor]